MAANAKRRRLSLNGTFEPSKADQDASVIPENSPTAVEKDQRRSLFVRSLPASITTERLSEYFSQTYPLKHAAVVLDRQTKLSKGFGFVTFTEPEDARAAAAEFHNSILDGRKIQVELAEPRHREIAEDGGKSVFNAKAIELRAEREKSRAEALPPKLIVRNLPWSIKEPEDLAQLFRSYGKVKHAVVPKRSPKVQAGFGFVILRGKKNAERALEGVNGKEVGGRTIAVDWAVDKKTWGELQAGDQVMQEPEDEYGIKGDIVPVESDDVNEHANDVNEAARDDRNDLIDEAGEELVSPAKGMSEELLEEDAELPNDVSSEDEPEQTPDNTTIFVRNLPFTSIDEDLQDHFSKFGAVRYARVVFDHETERSRGTGFVCFFNQDDAKSCVKNAPKHQLPPSGPTTGSKKRVEAITHSLLQNEATDPTGEYTIDGRILQVSRALSKVDAARCEAEGSSKRETRDRDKRRLYLLSEGTVSQGSELYKMLGPTEVNIREASAKQRQKLMKTNPSLHISLTRLSVRNIPRSVTSKDLKALAREAIVGFATDVKAGLRESLSKEELSRGAESMREAEKQRKLQGKGIVKQATIVFEGREGSKVPEKTGAGRSRGYGFIEYHSHRNALMGLRWLNGHMVKSSSDAGEAERGKRLIVEFAIENAQVVMRRHEMETKARTLGAKPRPGKIARDKVKKKSKVEGSTGSIGAAHWTKKRKRGDDDAGNLEAKDTKKTQVKSVAKAPVDEGDKNKLAKRNRIIARKRMVRRTRKAG